MDFELLYNTYYKQVFSYVMSLAGNRETAEEITQETFTRAMANIRNYRNDCSELTWLCSIAKNFFTDLARKQKHILEIPKDKDTDEFLDSLPVDECSSQYSEVEAKVEDADSSYRIHKILHSLEEPYKEVFQLRIFGELSFDKIGTIFGKTENWARVTYHRAKLKIQERMNEDG